MAVTNGQARVPLRNGSAAIIRQDIGFGMKLNLCDACLCLSRARQKNLKHNGGWHDEPNVWGAWFWRFHERKTATQTHKVRLKLHGLS